MSKLTLVLLGVFIAIGAQAQTELIAPNGPRAKAWYDAYQNGMASGWADNVDIKQEGDFWRSYTNGIAGPLTKDVTFGQAGLDWADDYIQSKKPTVTLNNEATFTNIWTGWLGMEIPITNDCLGVAMANAATKIDECADLAELKVAIKKQGRLSVLYEYLSKFNLIYDRYLGRYGTPESLD